LKATGWKSQVEMGLLSCHRISRVLKRMIDGKVASKSAKCACSRERNEKGVPLYVRMTVAVVSCFITANIIMPFIAHKRISLSTGSPRALHFYRCYGQALKYSSINAWLCHEEQRWPIFWKPGAALLPASLRTFTYKLANPWMFLFLLLEKDEIHFNPVQSDRSCKHRVPEVLCWAERVLLLYNVLRHSRTLLV
jgi:hypothetical protein